MRYLLLILIATLAVSLASRVHAQDTKVRKYDWTNYGFKGKNERLRPNDAVTLRVINFNALCYDLQIADSLVALPATDDSQLFKMLGEVPALDETTGKVEELLAVDTSKTKELDQPFQDKYHEQLSKLILVNKGIGFIEKRAADLAKRIRQFEERQTEARRAMEHFESEGCAPDFALRKNWKEHQLHFDDFVRLGESELPQAMRDLKEAEDSLAEVRKNLYRAEGEADALDKLLTAAGKSALSNGGFRQEVRTVGKLVDELERRLVKTKAALNVIDSNKQKVADARADIRRAIASSETSHKIFVEDNSRRIRVSMKALGRKGTAAENRVLTRAVVLPVKQQFRYFLSTGWMYSGVPADDFQRVTRFGKVTVVRPDGDGTTEVDSTFATFDNLSGDGNVLNRLAHSPVLMGTVTFSDSGIDVGASIGLTYRTVNKQQGVEFLLGLSGMIVDRFLFTVAIHVGRKEILLDESVRGKPVPTTLNASEVVGIQTVVRPAFVASIRLGGS